MDGERLSPRRDSQLERHLGECSGCRVFTEQAWRLRETFRFEVATEVPDLVGTIMTRVREEATLRRGGRIRLLWPGGPRGLRPRPVSPRGRLRRELSRLAVALVAGGTAGALVVASGIWPPETTAGALSPEEVSREVVTAATELRAYHATYTVSEWHFRPALPLREFTVNVWFSAPERFRLEVVDHTDYPRGSWPRNDLTLIVNGASSYSSAPASCPLESFPTCPLRDDEVLRLENRAPFAGASPVLTDAVLPVTTLAESNRLTVLGPGQVAGRPALRVALTYEDAMPVFAFVQQGGSWRPFFPRDRVVLWLDERTFLPLQYRVYPAGGAERSRWAASNGLPEEPPDRSIFQVSVVSFTERAPDPEVFAIPAGPATSQGARSVTLDEATEAVGRAPLVPEDTAGLDLYRVVLPPPGPDLPSDHTVVTFSSGLAWLKVSQTRAWREKTPFGAVSPRSERVELPNGGVAYYEPATGPLGRRLSIHAKGVDLYLETNLPRQKLMEIAASLPVEGGDLPADWLIRRSKEGESEVVPLDRALAEVDFPVALPSDLPVGYRAVSAELVRVGERSGLNVYFQAAETAPANAIQLHAEAASELPPASGAEQFVLDVRGQRGRWTPDRYLLEWVEEGVYYSISGLGLELEEALAIADSMEVPTELSSAESPASSPEVRT
jgi:hypothetical protein